MICVAVPAMDEPGLVRMLLGLERQRILPDVVAVCINQPAAYYQDGFPEHGRICRTNRQVFEQVSQLKKENRFSFPLEVIDRFSPGKAWDARHVGVGWARRTAMDYLARICLERGGNLQKSLLVCMDADTRYPDDYLENIRSRFDAYPKAVGLANPYYHVLDRETEPHAFAMLHYESYMRAYALNMMRAGHPYAFTAVGSSMACTAEAYRKIGGISPFKSGEDFYFLQKLAKTGDLIRFSPSFSHPSCRLSTRVFFGTGPALNKGIGGRWESYPFYPFSLFEQMRRGYAALPALFESGRPGPDLDFWQESFGPGWWENIRANAGGRESQFVKGCIQKFDALRSLQFLKSSYRQDNLRDWTNLRELLEYLLRQQEKEGSGNFSRTGEKTGTAETGGPYKGSGSFLKSEPFLKDDMEKLLSRVSIKGLSDLSLQDWKSVRDFLFLSECRQLEKQPLLPCS